MPKLYRFSRLSITWLKRPFMKWGRRLLISGTVIILAFALQTHPFLSRWTATATQAQQNPAAAILAQWEDNMVNYGQQHAVRLDDLVNGNACEQENLSESDCLDQQLAMTYYDAGHVYTQIADYTGDSSWDETASLASEVYADYVLRNLGVVPGYWNFSAGLEDQYNRTRNERYRQAVAALATSAAFTSFNTNDNDPSYPTARWTLSREVALGIKTLLSARRLGLFDVSDNYFSFLYGNGRISSADRNIGSQMENRLSELLEFALGHLDQWFIDESDPALYVKPFMVGLTASALIEYDEEIGDPRIVPRLQLGLAEMWNEAWVPTSQAFRYLDRLPSDTSALDGPCNTPSATEPPDYSCLLDPAPDLNLLISPAYQWLELQTRTGQAQWAADQIGKGGVELAYLSAVKQFNQNYFWSFDQVEWRKSS